MSRPETSERGIDRRSALKKVAAGGAIAWASPMVLSQKAHAVEFIPGTTCTAKCTPRVTLNLNLGSGTALVIGCEDGPPGLQPLIVRITSFTLAPGSSAECPCGGTPEIIAAGGGPIVGQVFVIRPRPGNAIATFVVPVAVTCTDRSGDRITINCTIVASTRVTGNCNSNTGRTLDLTFIGTRCNPDRVCT